MPDTTGLQAFEVIGELPIRDAATKVSVPKGGTVHLDPERTIISALIEGGAIRPVNAEKPAED